MKKVLILLLIWTASACHKAPEVTLNEGINHYGLQITEENPSDIKTAMSGLVQGTPVNAKIEGTIGAVCQSKGCWMTLGDNSSSTEVFIKFKDYAFFVPKNAAGQKAIVLGELSLEETPVDELRHYAEDEGKTAEEIAAIVEPKVELKMMAEGVLIYN